jgi:hypothetical protein
VVRGQGGVAVDEDHDGDCQVDEAADRQLCPMVI